MTRPILLPYCPCVLQIQKNGSTIPLATGPTGQNEVSRYELNSVVAAALCYWGVSMVVGSCRQTMHHEKSTVQRQMSIHNMIQAKQGLNAHQLPMQWMLPNTLQSTTISCGHSWLKNIYACLTCCAGHDHQHSALHGALTSLSA